MILGVAVGHAPERGCLRALGQVGREPLGAAARRIGTVEVDHGETGCKTPDAEPYIKKTLAHRKKKAKKLRKQAKQLRAQAKLLTKKAEKSKSKKKRKRRRRQVAQLEAAAKRKRRKANKLLTG